MKALLITIACAVLLAGFTVDAKPALKRTVKKTQSKKIANKRKTVKRPVKRSLAYRKTRADIAKAVDDVFHENGNRDSGYSEPTVDLSELELDR